MIRFSIAVGHRSLPAGGKVDHKIIVTTKRCSVTPESGLWPDKQGISVIDSSLSSGLEKRNGDVLLTTAGETV